MAVRAQQPEINGTGRVQGKPPGHRLGDLGRWWNAGEFTERCMGCRQTNLKEWAEETIATVGSSEVDILDLNLIVFGRIMLDLLLREREDLGGYFDANEALGEKIANRNSRPEMTSPHAVGDLEQPDPTASCTLTQNQLDPSTTVLPLLATTLVTIKSNLDNKTHYRYIRPVE
ncbi:hypothetical protein SODALDRAFT_360176 [Sodiomyces alkalinus F11]|uniref:Uncharacterized protein n=1 Tax=Sodiomyces alkalinus (strain CBS 110278 / VKM F-3762 / F11) TaxID=1314773 RepID=A0A3N2PTQ1_SODAK|nr:hypothetical protein SODALDRAFT_360176 [Sodiomyces alkalinus F11]ROT37883.1 hypothetical protein SODALDRAFT_360176 [Sodiomyces alkalinus F11]